LVNHRDVELRAVQGSAAALAGDKQFIPHRVIDDSEDRFPRIFKSYRNGERR
jgi:hypothetical protein